jgi:hypothetical protein
MGRVGCGSGDEPAPIACVPSALQRCLFCGAPHAADDFKLVTGWECPGRGPKAA